VAGAVLAGAGLLLLTVGLRTPGQPPAAAPIQRDTGRPAAEESPAAHRPVAPGRAARVAAAPPASPLPRSRPLWLEIARISVRTPLLELGLDPGGALAMPPPAAHAPAGWYRYLASPGETGPAVIAGHVDSAHDGPAVFFRLGALHPGDRIDVGRADHRVAHFDVTEVFSVPKSRFPSATVYGPADRPVLRLVTCGGTFDRATGHYRDSVVVLARFTGASAVDGALSGPAGPRDSGRPGLPVAERADRPG
jgi:hypothetical protein